MDERTFETKQIADEQLSDVVGGTRDNAYLEPPAREAVDADDEGEDQVPIPFAKCPMCGRPFRFCTCYR